MGSGSQSESGGGPPNIASLPGNHEARVLVIDDDPTARLVMREVLRNVGLVLDLGSPIGATQVAISNLVEVVVIDIQMPNLRGDMLAKLFRNNPKLSHVGVVLVSGCSPEELQRFGQDCGADAVVTKKDVRADLELVVRRVCTVSRNRRLDAHRRSSPEAVEAAAPQPRPAPAETPKGPAK